MRISDWSSDVCSSDLIARQPLTHTVMYTGAKNECSLWLATNVELMGIFKLARVEACRLRPGIDRHILQNSCPAYFRVLSCKTDEGDNAGPMIAQEIGRASCRESV